MPIIDLTLPLYTGMPVYPWDPEVSIEDVLTLEENGWEMKRLEINTHTGTHVNVPTHGKAGGKTLDAYIISDFIAPARLYSSFTDIVPGEGIVFHALPINMEIAEHIVQIWPAFVGISQRFEFDPEIEHYLLDHDIISYEQLINTDKLPERFIFHGVPLRIRDGDGSPVRAYAIPIQMWLTPAWRRASP